MQTKKIIRRIILTVLEIFIFQTCFCQKNYSPGYIIQLNGDTLNGFICNHEGWRNPDKIFFKEDLNDSNTIFSPLNIKGFSVQGKWKECQSELGNQDRKEQYYIKQDSTYELLIYKEYVKILEDKYVIIENKKYLGQLLLYLQGALKFNQNLRIQNIMMRA